MMRIQSPLLAAVPGLVHGFTTRNGGVSRAPYGALNLALKPEEPAAILLENWSRVLTDAGVPGATVAVVHQVHGDRVVNGDGAQGPLHALAQADGVVVTRPGVVAAVRVADCVPILLAAPGAVAAVHAGWRGTVAPIVPRAVDALCAAAGCAPGDVVAAIGPCISGDVYRVGPEVVDAVCALGLDHAVHRDAPDLVRVDLKACNRTLLEQAGVTRVDVLPHCSLSDARFYSHRGGDPGRQVGFIGLRA